MNENIVSDSVVDKIKKLLALGTSANEHESSLALQKAKKLAAENEVDISLIEIFTKTKKQAAIEKNGGISLGQRKSVTQSYVSWILQAHFKVRVIYSGNRSYGRFMYLIGTKENIEIAEYVQNFLNQEFMRLWRNELNAGRRVEERNSYLLGLHNGLDAKLAAEQTQVVSEKLSTHTEDTRNQFALMVVNEKERLEKAVSSFYPKLGHATHYNPKSYHSDAIAKGTVAGGQINIRRSIGNNYQDNRIAA